MTAPRRIQRRRTKGWRMPEGAIYVGRGSKWGNPFRAGGFVYLSGPKAGQTMTAADAVQSFRTAAMSNTATDFRAQARADLAGRDLACWCPLDQPCHADVLLELANQDLT